MSKYHLLTRIVDCNGVPGVVGTGVVPAGTAGVVRVGVVDIIPSICAELAVSVDEVLAVSREGAAVHLVPVFTVLLQVVCTGDPRVCLNIRQDHKDCGPTKDSSQDHASSFL